MAELEIRELRYFRAVAEEGSLSGAATRLGMTQPPLSRAIRALERRLGGALFDRGPGGVVATAAGTVLLEESVRVLDAVAAATQRTRRALHMRPELVLAVKPSVATEVVRSIVDAFGAVPGNPGLTVVVGEYGEQAGRVRRADADAAVLGSPFEHEGLQTTVLFTQARVAALPVGHALTRAPLLRCRDLIGHPTPQCPPGTPAVVRDYWAGRDVVGAAAPGDQEPEGPIVRDSSHLLEVVALGHAVALVPESLATAHPRPDICYRPVADASPYAIALATRPGDRDPWIAELRRIAVSEHQADVVHLSAVR